MTIKIENMDMPKDCENCPLLYDGYACMVADINDDTLGVSMCSLNARPIGCPLKECK